MHRVKLSHSTNRNTGYTKPLSCSGPPVSLFITLSLGQKNSNRSNNNNSEDLLSVYQAPSGDLVSTYVIAGDLMTPAGRYQWWVCISRGEMRTSILQNLLSCMVPG